MTPEQAAACRAATEYAKGICGPSDSGGGPLFAVDLAAAFVAGARWQKERAESQDVRDKETFKNAVRRIFAEELAKEQG